MNSVRQQFRSLGALLMERGLLTQSQLDSALDEQKRSGERLGRILVTRGWVRDKDILTVLQGMMVVVFQLAGEEFGVETLLVREIIRHQESRSVPDAPPWIVGVIDYRGHVVPVVDMALRLGRPTLPVDLDTRIIIYEGSGGRSWGLQVAGVSAVVQVGREQLDDAQAGQTKRLPARWLAGLVRLSGRSVTLLSIDEVLAEGAPEPAAPETGP
jgi:purine-binding chemotaxis protein CheW